MEVSGASAFANRRLDGAEGRAHRVGVSQVELDSSHVELVGDRLGIDLQHDRVAEIFSGGHGRVEGLGNHGLDRGDPVGGQQLLRFGFSEHGPALTADGGDDRLCALSGIGRGLAVVQQNRRLVQPLKVVRRAPHEREDVGGRIGVFVGGNARLVEDLPTGLDGRAAHPTGQDRLAADLGVLPEMLRRGRGVGHGLRSQDRKQTIDVGILRRDLQRAGITPGVGVAQDVDRVAVAPCGRENCVKRGHGLGRERGQLPLVLNQRVGRQDSGAAGVGQDRQPRSLGPGLLG